MVARFKSTTNLNLPNKCAMAYMMKLSPVSYISATHKITKMHNNLKQIFSAPSLFSSKSCSISTTASIFTHSHSQVEVSSSDSSTNHNDSPFTGLDEVMAGYILGKKKATEVAHAVWKNVVRKGDLVIDATCGNGYDTLAMLRLIADDTRRGRVYAMDLQKDALERTSSLLDSSLDSLERELVELYAMCHSKMEELVRSGYTVRLVAFNLCYLPEGDKKIKTESDTTLLALEAAKRILSRRSLISILAYVGHSGGREEFEKVESFAAELPVDKWVSCKLQMLNRPSAPVLVLISRKCGKIFILDELVISVSFGHSYKPVSPH